jgi:DNA-directed RNA polymerase specialized sigma subunit
VRNLCLDWHRREFGRNRVFASIARLGKLEQEVFRLRFLEGLSAEETLLAFSPAFRPLGATEIAEAAERVHAALTPRQRWLLEVRRPKVFQSMGRPVESGRATPLEVTDPAPDPETAVLLGQQKDALSRALARLSKRDRLLLRLRFEQELTLAQIARFTGRPSPQQADREIRELLERLGKELA